MNGIGDEYEKFFASKAAKPSGIHYYNKNKAMAAQASASANAW